MPAIDRRSVTSACAACGSEPASAASTPWYSGRLSEACRVSSSRSCASRVLRLKSLTSRRFQAGARSSASISAGEQRDVADPDFRRGDAVVAGGFETERQHLGVGRRLVGAAERIRCRPAEISGEAAPRLRNTGPR